MKEPEQDPRAKRPVTPQPQETQPEEGKPHVPHGTDDDEAGDREPPRR